MWELMIIPQEQIIKDADGYNDYAQTMADRPVNRKNLYDDKKVAEAAANYMQYLYGTSAWVGLRKIVQLKGGE